MIYLESIETSNGKGNENDQNGISFRREKFRQHILQSTCVQFSYLLSRLESSSAGADLHYEKAILYGKVSTYILFRIKTFCKMHQCGLTFFTLPSFNAKIRRQCIKTSNHIRATYKTFDCRFEIYNSTTEMGFCYQNSSDIL